MRPHPFTSILLLPLLLAQTRPATPIAPHTHDTKTSPLIEPSTLPPDKLVDNPLHKACLALPPGTCLLIQQETTVDGATTTSDSLLTLVAITQEEIVIELGDAAGKFSSRLSLPAKVEPGEEPLCCALAPLPGRRKDFSLNSHEAQDVQLTIDGKSINTRLYTTSYSLTTGYRQPWPITIRTWFSPDVTAGIARVQIDAGASPGRTAQTYTYTIKSRALPPATQPATRPRGDGK